MHRLQCVQALSSIVTIGGIIRITSIGQTAMQAPHPKHLISSKMRLCPGSLAMLGWIVLLLFRSTHPLISTGIQLLVISYLAFHVNDNKLKSQLIIILCCHVSFCFLVYIVFTFTLEIGGWGDRFEGVPPLRVEYGQDLVPFSRWGKGGGQCWMYYSESRL